MRKFLLILLALSVFCSCLKETPKSFDTAENYYKSEVQIRTGLNGCYTPLRSIFAARGFWFMCDMDTDISYISSNTYYDANCGVSPAKPSVGSTIWKNGYLGVMRCNEMIADIQYAIDKGYVKAAAVKDEMAEAVVMRALFYYLLTCTFGDVPYYEQKVTEQNRAEIACLPRMSADATRNYCIGQLTYYLLDLKALPMQRTYDNESYYIGAAVGLMIGAKMSLWNERWDDALNFITALESIYGSYGDRPYDFGSDYPLNQIPFSVRYAKESILELSNRVEDYGIQVSGIIASCAMPRRITSDSASEEEGSEEYSINYAGILIPELGGYARVSTAARPTSYFYEQLMSYYSNDKRSGEYTATTTPRNGSGTLAWRWYGYDADKDPDMKNPGVFFFNGMSSSSKPYLGNKFWAYGMYNTKDPNNYKVFRFADALLMKAEAYAMSGKYDDACKYLSITRTRAGLEAIKYSGLSNNPEILMEEIRRERAKELFGEFQRKFDLVRWGIWYDRTVTYNEDKFLQENIRRCHEYWPIPADQVAYSNNALDNNAYMED